LSVNHLSFNQKNSKKGDPVIETNQYQPDWKQDMGILVWYEIADILTTANSSTNELKPCQCEEAVPRGEKSNFHSKT